MNSEASHICVCICTYRRPKLLRRLLEKVSEQVTDDLFTYSIVVVDNDRLRSADALVTDFAGSSSIPIRYFVEPQQNIPMARNRAVENSTGEFVTFIDDDEFPSETWLMTLFKACKQYGADGVVGPVYRHFDEVPPKWIVKGMFWQRPTYPTGLTIDGTKGRTNNALVKRSLFATDKDFFRPEFKTGEDQDFFIRMIEAGHVFVWCNEAIVYEVVPPERWKRSFLLKRSLFQGSFSPSYHSFGVSDFLKSLVAIPVYAAILPFVALVSHHRFMALLAKLAYHLGAVLAYLGIRVIKQPYITN